jgi:hypothetical protein
VSPERPLVVDVQSTLTIPSQGIDHFLEARIREQRRQLRFANEANQRHTRELDALHMVWCDGGCPRGVHRWAEEQATADEIDALADVAQQNVDRMRRWANAKRSRDRRAAPVVPPEEKTQ